MSDKSFRGFFLLLTVTAMLFYSVVGTTTVFADDGTGTEPTETETAPSTDEGEPTDTGTEEQPVDEAPTEEVEQPVDEVPTEEVEQAVDEVPTEEVEQPVEEVTVEEVIEQLPEETTVTVLDSEGEALPLASQEAADVIETSEYDPIWCPAGQDPTPNENGCTDSFSSFDELLTFLQANEGDTAYQTAGTIYIQQGPYLGGESEIDFNDYTFNNFNQYDLTLQGGWDTDWDPDVNPFPEYTTTSFNAPITIGSSSNPWVGSLTIKDISISGVNQTGLTVYSEGNIALDNVEVTDSKSGANLDAGGGVDITDSKFNNNKEGGANVKANGMVFVDNSEFNNNGSKKTNGYGLKIVTNDEVDIFATSASFNEVFGADITTTGDVYIYGGVFSGNVSYSYSCWNKTTANGGYGLKVVSQGDIFIDWLSEEVVGDGVQANDNYEFGAYLEGVNVSVGYSTFDNNEYGLKIVSHATEGTGDAVSLQYVTANNNELFGADVSAELGVSITNSFFDGNKSYVYSCKGNSYFGYGLQVITSGSILLSDVSASENNLFGAHLEGANIGISNSLFNNNGSDKSITGSGLKVVSTDAVNLSNVEANNNQLFGADIVATNTVNIASSFFNGNKSYTYSCKGNSYKGYGLKVVTDGTINLDEVEANNNNLFGASLDGANILVAYGYFDNNGASTDGYGLKVVSDEGASLTHIQANNNKSFGADVQAGGLVSISDSFFNGNKSYTYSCKGNSYQGYGLKVVTANDISLTNVEANENYLYGAHLEGQTINVSFGTFSNNGTGNLSDHIGKGLEVVSNGDEFDMVSLYQVNANNNQEFGANIQSNGYVSISDSVFSGNVSYTAGKCKQKDYEGYGLKVVTTNDIYLYNVTANDNGTFGATLEGNFVTVENSTFNNNKTSHGLEITADTVVLNSVTALNNGVDGAKLCAVNEATVNGSTFNNNKRYGLNVGAPVFSESGNTYLNNGSTGLFYNPSCATNGGNNNGGGHGWDKPKKDWNWGWGWGWNNHKPKNGHGNSYYGGSSHKSCHSYGKKW
jgi:hypothetical protein